MLRRPGTPICQSCRRCGDLRCADSRVVRRAQNEIRRQKKGWCMGNGMPSVSGQTCVCGTNPVKRLRHPRRELLHFVLLGGRENSCCCDPQKAGNIGFGSRFTTSDPRASNSYDANTDHGKARTGLERSHTKTIHITCRYHKQVKGKRAQHSRCCFVHRSQTSPYASLAASTVHACWGVSPENPLRSYRQS